MSLSVSRIMAVICLSLLLTACFPPAFYSTVNVYAVANGSDVGFVIKVANDPASVTCFGGDVVMAWVDGDTWQGTADYTNDLGGAPGITAVSCTAANRYGTVTSNVGRISLIENQLPQIVMLSNVTICGNDGTLQINEPLVDMANSLYMTGATYALTQGSLPSGLIINSTTGNLQGTPAAGNYNMNNLKMTATTMVGSDQSNNFSITIQQSICL